MRVNIGPIKGKRGASMRLDFEERMASPWGEDASLQGPVNVALVVSNTGKGYLFRGSVSADAELSCDRCATPFAAKVEADVEEEFFPRRPERDRGDPWQVDEPDEAATHDADADFEENTFSGDVLDIADAVREWLVLALPIKALCRDDCKGICAGCGRNRNAHDCDCRQETTDPRLASLAELLKDEKET